MSSSNKVVTWSNLGSSGLKISNIIIGCAQYGSKDWMSWVEDDEEKIFKILKKAYDHGIRTYDTADAYSNGLSEVILGKFLKKYNIKRDKVVIMTKVHQPVDDLEHDGPDAVKAMIGQGLTEIEEIDFLNNKGLSRKHIFEGIQGSLRRLGVDYIDVYQIHRYDHSTPPIEFMKALNDVIEKGWAMYIGASSMKAVEFVELQHIAEKNGWHKFINVQSEYHLLNREDEPELNYYANKTGVGITPYSSLARGTLARPIPKDTSHLTEREEASRGLFKPITEEEEETSDSKIINSVKEIADKRNVAMATVSLSWLISKGCSPIVGVSSEDRLDALIEATHFKLTEEEIKYLEEPYKTKTRIFFF